MTESNKEFTLKKYLTRLLAYPFCIFIFFASLKQFLNATDSIAVLIGLLFMVVSAIYLVSDLRIILKAKKANKKSV